MSHHVGGLEALESVRNEAKAERLSSPQNIRASGGSVNDICLSFFGETPFKHRSPRSNRIQCSYMYVLKL